MNIKSFFQDLIKGNTTALKLRFSFLKRRIARRLDYILNKRKYDEMPISEIPVIINNYNRLTYLMKLIKWLEQAGMRNIYILDNDSSYPPLLDYYSKCSHRVVFLKKNEGYRALWLRPELRHLIKDFYIYTDPDVVPDAYCPMDVIEVMYTNLKSNFKIDKIGIGLRIDNLPDHYSLKQKVIDWESQFHKKPVNELFYQAPVDTTFALYAPYSEGGGECKAYRTRAPYQVLHLPWYENSVHPDSESLFYLQHQKGASTHWTSITTKGK